MSIAFRFLGALALLLSLSPSVHSAAPSVATGYDRTCAVSSGGAAACWGDNSSGALGNSATIWSGLPNPVSGLSSGVAALGSSFAAKHNCAITEQGAVLCWGNNANGQLGNGTLLHSTVPAPVAGLTSPTAAIAAGSFFTCALSTSGAVSCWGDNAYGQLGYSGDSSVLPVAVAGLGSGIRAISAGAFHACALTNGGAVLCWGNNVVGQLGDGTTTNRSSPVTVKGLPPGIASVLAAGAHSCAVTTSGAVWCWGDNSVGQLGIGTTTAGSPVPVAVTGLDVPVAQISGGLAHTCAVTTAGSVFCWGLNGDGELGNGTTTNSLAAVAVSGLSSGIRSVSAGKFFTCAIDSRGAVLCWGDNSFGQFGNGGNNPSTTPVAATALSVPVVAIVTGQAHTCALTASHAELCWGSNAIFELGNGQEVGVPTATTVTGMSSGIVGVAVGIAHACALNTAGGVACWGNNPNGQLGNGRMGDSASFPRDTLLTSGIKSIGAGFDHTCAVTSSGAAVCWGSNVNGALGDGSKNASSKPVAVSGLSAGVAAVAGGALHTCALSTTGAVRCWGYNVYGQLGNGSTADSAVPVPVQGLSSGIAALALGGWHSCALTTAGNVLCWGDGLDGRLGNGSTNDSAVPVAVPGLTVPMTAITAGFYHTCALATTGAVYCWGSNIAGQLGNGTTDSSSVPVAVAGLPPGIVAIAAGRFHTCALTASGYVVCWGYNSAGALGDGTFANRASPVVTLREHGAGGLATNDWFLDLDPAHPKAIPADKVPPYLIVASGNAATAVVNVKVNALFPAQEVGQRIFIYGYVPASLVKRRVDPAKDDTACVLAQIDASGLPVGTTASSLTSLAGNVVTTAGQTVSVLDNVLAGNVAGATFCIGAGSTGTDALAASNSRCVATIPQGSSNPALCLPPSRTTAAVNAPGPLSGLWWNSGESGWGVSFTQRRNVVFAAWFTYDAVGAPKWYVASNCAMASAGATSGACNGTLYEVSGPTFFSPPFNPSLVTPAAVGALRVDFQDASHASMSYTVGSQGRVVPITRQVFGAGTSPPAVDYSDLWWNASESGWGLSITHQYGVMFLAWFIYDNAGKPTWYVASNCAVSGSGCSGTLYRASGPPFGGTFDSSRVVAVPAGTVSVNFAGPNDGTLNYNVNGTSSSKSITRQVF